MKKQYSKLILLLGICFMMLIPAKSQILISILLGDQLNSGGIEFGLTGGLTRSYMMQSDDAKGLSSFNLGFYFDFRLKKEKTWYLYTGVLVKSNLGASNCQFYTTGDKELDEALDSTSARISRQINYFIVPITVKYRFKNNIFVLAGVQASLRSKAYDNYETTYNDNDIVYKRDAKDNYNRIDFGLTAGAGYKFRYGAMMNIGLRYYYGLVDAFKNDVEIQGGPSPNSALFVFAEIPIGAERKVRPPREKKDKKKKI